MSGSSHYLRFVAALLFSAALIYGDLSLGLFANLRGDMSVVLTPFRVAATAPQQGYRAARDYFRGREELLREKAELEGIIRENDARLKSLDFFVSQNDDLRAMMGLRRRLDGQWQAASLRHDFSQPLADRVYLDKGVDDGVFPGMAVVDDNGVMGQVIRADSRTSVVKLITNRDQWLSARVSRNHLLVILRGDGDGGLRVEYAPNSADLRVGDDLVADGGVFPPGYPIAVIAFVAEGAVYKEARAAPLSAFWDVAAALVYSAVPADGAPRPEEPALAR